MMWLTRSLFGRNLLLIVALMALSQLASVLLVRRLVLAPRQEQVAEGLVRRIVAVRSGLMALPPGDRAAFVAAFNQDAAQASAGPAARPLADDEAPRPPLSARERRLLRALQQGLAGQGVVLSWQPEDGATLSAHLALDGQDHVLRLTGVLPPRDGNGTWLVASATMAALALLGAWAIQRHLNRPLARVVHAAGELGRGASVPPLPEGGPTETATLARSINQLSANLEQAERERALMLAGVSHDLRTPLAKLRLGVEILQRDNEPELNASLARSIEDMDRIIGQFLDFARVDSTEPASLVDVNALVQQLAAAQADHGQRLTLALAPLPPLPLRPQALQRALGNLVENAHRHGHPPVTVSTGGDAHSLWVDVTDQGPGIAPAEAEALKQPFRRKQAARDGAPGAGLGLAIVDRLARLHGGRLELLVNSPCGLRARLVLPRAPHGPLAAQPQVQPPST
jgi:two-component system, OmpR family, osmolarity sensor histidine kinase EnvZ